MTPGNELLLRKLSAFTAQLYCAVSPEDELRPWPQPRGRLMAAEIKAQQELRRKTQEQTAPVLLQNAGSTGGLCTSDGMCVLIGPLERDSYSFEAHVKERLKAVNALLELYCAMDWNRAEHNIPIDKAKITSFLQEIKSNSKLKMPSLADVLPSDSPHNTYAYEQGHLDGITQGDPEKAVRALLSPMHGKEGRMGFTELRQCKNSAIINAVLAARAAIRGGLGVEEAYITADFFILASELCRTPDEAKLLRQTITYRFAELVQERRQGSARTARPLVRSIVQEIERHLFQKTDRSQLLSFTKCSTDYAERLFKEDLGMSIMDYLRDLRIRTACDLLSGSQLKIGEIASLLQFSSTSHFARVFKKVTGKAPLEFRGQHLQH